MGNDINDSKLVGGKRKNGHKLNCSCHICENMKNKAKRGGYQEEEEKAKENMMGGSKKKNGHRKACKCPICKNMKNSKKRGGGKSSKTKKRNEDEDEEEENSDSDSSDEEEKEENNDSDNENEKKEENSDSDSSDEEEEKKGGRKKKRGNGHKVDCKCPICKNMRKKKGGQDPAIEDVSKGSNETPASADDYDALDDAERGKAGPNIGGGTLRRRKTCKKNWNCKTRKSRRSRRRH